ncbi:MAG TPA: tetratricopeptide repeat protein [Verrucomicrobiae bacterium]|nr:tetratricopeptide repeat protein [Verrucomicrobiae bacterium]
MSSPRRELEKALAVVESRLRSKPTLDLSFERARLLDRLGRVDDARRGYVDILKRDPAHFGALNDLGTLLYKAGMLDEATTCYAAAVAKHPGNAIGHANFAFMLLRGGDAVKAREHYEEAVRLDPKNAEAHRGLALALGELGETGAAREHREAGFREHPIAVVPYRGAGEAVRALVLVSASPGNTRTDSFLDDRIFEVGKLVVEYYDPSVVLPAHDFVFNAVGDPEASGAALEAARAVLLQTDAPAINPPAAVAATDRVSNARRLAAIPGLRAPRTERVERSVLTGSQGAEHLAQLGFAFPLLLRSPGFHTGKHFEMVGGPAELAAVAQALPGDALLAIEYVDARGVDAKVRKYRAMLIAGELYPLHLAIANQWKVHYFSADMAENAAHRLEEERFLADMPAAIGPRAMEALARAGEILALDYAGIDFTIARDGSLVVFEANATMVVPPPDEDARWDYKRAPVERIYEAVRRMLLAAAGR